MRGGSTKNLDAGASRPDAVLSESDTQAPLPLGGILAALRRSPLVGAKLALTRSTDNGRQVFKP